MIRTKHNLSDLSYEQLCSAFLIYMKIKHYNFAQEVANELQERQNPNHFYFGIKNNLSYIVDQHNKKELKKWHNRLFNWLGL